MKPCHLLIALAGLACVPDPALAQQEAPAEPSAFDGDYLSVGIGAAYGPTYDGSDDYTYYAGPIAQGSLGGVDIRPRAGGLALDLVPGPVSLGLAGRLRRNRASDIKDPVVDALGELDSAVELGPTIGYSVQGLLNPYDSLGVNVDVRWDVAGAHGGMVVDPSISYFTPLNRGMAASLSVSAEHGDGDYMDYYYAVSPAQALASGLPGFDPQGGGFTRAGATLLLGVDLDGELANGGFAVVVVGGYSRMLGDARRSPFTSVRGSADQFLGAVGVGYTF